MATYIASSVAAIIDPAKWQLCLRLLYEDGSPLSESSGDADANSIWDIEKNGVNSIIARSHAKTTIMLVHTILESAIQIKQVWEM